DEVRAARDPGSGPILATACGRGSEEGDASRWLRAAGERPGSGSATLTRFGARVAGDLALVQPLLGLEHLIAVLRLEHGRKPPLEDFDPADQRDGHLLRRPCNSLRHPSMTAEQERECVGIEDEHPGSSAPQSRTFWEEPPPGVGRPRRRWASSTI